jgi:hypothetical protein
MYLIHKSTKKESDGMIEIELYIVNQKKAKHYTYNLASQYAAEKFHTLYNKGRKCHGRALTILKKFQV